ncbi:MAG: LuxR C-terminal-related transcriptional regulator, partial [Chloroflexota bacterium]
ANQSQQLLDYLHQKELLLILDNLDLALDHAEFVSRILQGAPKITVLATSREKLGLREEQLYGISGLDFTRSDREADALSLDALQLFLQGARRVKPDFDPEQADVVHVLHICRLVDGSPLAILMAAAWIELLRPQEIGAEIEHSLDILSTDLRNVPERQRSIRAVLESTWRQLDEPERAIFVKLSIFRGGFMLKAAQSVTSATLRQLMLMTDKSLIWRDRSGRFLVHQLPLQFAHEKLVAEPEVERQARMQHSQYYGQLLSELDHKSSAAESGQLMNKVALDLRNVRAGWRWAAEWGTLELVKRYSAGLRRFFEERGWYLGGAEDAALYERALQRVSVGSVDATDREYALCQLHEILGDIAMLSGQNEATRQHYDTALAQLPDGEHLWQARLSRKKANTFRGQTQFDKAIENYSLAELTLQRQHNRTSAWWQEWIQIQLELAWLNYWQGNLDAVTTLNEEVRPQVEHHGTLAQQVNFFNALAAMGFRKDAYLDTWDSVGFTQIAYERSLESGNPHDIAWSEFTHGFSLLWCAEYDQAAELMQAALSLARENGDFVHQARCATYLTILYRKRGDPDLVQHFAQTSLQLAKRANLLEYSGTAHANQAWLAWHVGNHQEAVSLAKRALLDWRSLGPQHASVAFKWTAIWPLIAVALCDGRIADAVAYGRQLLEPGQQGLPAELRARLESAIDSWASQDVPKTRAYLLSAASQSDLLPPLSDVVEAVEPGSQVSSLIAHSLLTLTPRESEVLGLIAAGYSNKEIAEQLVVQVSTVKKHINHLFAKLDVDSRTRAIVRAQELDLL